MIQSMIECSKMYDSIAAFLDFTTLKSLGSVSYHDCSACPTIFVSTGIERDEVQLLIMMYARRSYTRKNVETLLLANYR